MYVFRFRDSGELWEIDDVDFKNRAGWWMRCIVHELKWFRWFWMDECKNVSFVECYHDDRYYGSIGVGDLTVTWSHSPRLKDGHKFSYCTKKRSREHDGTTKICNC